MLKILSHLLSQCLRVLALALSMRSLRQVVVIFFSTLLITTACTQTTTQVSVPTASGDKPAMTMTHGGKSPININEAILSQLDKVEGKLGIAGLSHKIQAARPYTKIEDLVAKKVITQAQFEQVKDVVSVETIALSGEAKDIDYMLKLGLMKGHMIVAKQLLDLKKPQQAEPHIGHPVEEIYADVEEQLTDRNVKEFKTSLGNLQALIKSKPNDPKVATTFTESITAIDDAIAILPEAQRTSPKFLLQVINGLLDTANSEYTAAIADGKIKEIIEYQDSRGFVAYADQLYTTIAAQMTQDHPAEHTKLSTNISKLKTAWPTAIAPTVPVLSIAQVTDLVKSNESAAAKVYMN
jgi:hypothetical protein